jgi:general secretion pathway protein J
MSATLRRTGFTLVEVLIALLIFGLIAAGGVAMLRFSVDNRAAMKTVSDRGTALQRARQLIRADLAQAAPRGARDPTGQAEPAFLGGRSDRLLTLTRAGWSNIGDRPRSSLQRVDYQLVDGRLERVIHQQLDGGETMQPQVLYEGVTEVSITFLSGGFESPIWPANEQRQMPDAVRIDMNLEGYGPVSQWFLVGGGAG